MPKVLRIELYQRLSGPSFQAIEQAYALCRDRGNPYVELVHWIHEMQQHFSSSDFSLILDYFGVAPSRIEKDLTRALEELPSGGTSRPPAFSEDLDKAVQEGWSLAQLVFRDTQVRSGYVLLGILQDDGLSKVLDNISGEFRGIKVHQLMDDYDNIVRGSMEDKADVGRRPAAIEEALGRAARGERAGQAPGEGVPDEGKASALDRFSTDLTERARAGEIDPIVGRDSEIRQIADILMRRRQNNPILLGEAGVGKTAVAEGFALRIASGDVPPPLKDVRLCALDLGSLQAGASVKGEFEERLRKVIEEVRDSAIPVILFIDEAHTLIGAGGRAGQGDAANLLKPALARGTLRTIAATTFDEYKKYFEDDAALQRRFQEVTVDEPSVEKTVLMLRGQRSTLEKHHGVEILDEALDAAANLSHRYMPARRLPDKAVSLIDTACARVGISQHALPGLIDDCKKRIGSLKEELEGIDREIEVGIDHAERRDEVAKRIEADEGRLEEMEARWEKERALVVKINELRAKLRKKGDGDPATGEAELSVEERDEVRKELIEVTGQLRELQGEAPLILPTVDGQAVASVVADWTGVPVGRMVKNEIDAVLRLVDTLEGRVIGQTHALEAIAKRIQTARASLDNPGRPVGVFLLVGPSGVGKTETALALAEALFGGEHNAITINMSEYQEQYTVSLLKGSPPGYEGHKEGGVLTNAVRRRPYTVVLLDEVEKAHQDVHEIFFQVFDKGVLLDSKGQTADFKNTIILLTSNVGSDIIMDLWKDPELIPKDPSRVANALRDPLRAVFPAALLGRLVVVPYSPISEETLLKIIRLQITRIEQRLAANHKAKLSYDDAVVDLIKSRCHEIESGARMVDAILTHTVLPEMSRELLNRMMEGKSIDRVQLSVENNDFRYDFQ